ncbi:MAG: four helix bundle protein [Candidatus Methylomirabilota bacterium]|nr:four helix bundle protein [Candidatus Methylomirabilis sp.]NJD67785.1 four helix bundle protein [candidate division NC10 bacterium]PWB47223.1 MAG: four helix bundle protein [candidate division NC10 bacterium]
MRCSWRFRDKEQGKSKKVKGKNGAKRPRDIKERTFRFALEILRLCKELDERPDVGRTLGKQLLRSGTSIGANAEEAQAGQSKADFVSKYAIALKEARETLYWLRLLKESGSLRDGSIDMVIQEADELSRIIGSIIVKAKQGSDDT